MNILGFEVDARVERMVARVEQLSPRRPLMFTEISSAHHAIGGAEVFSDKLSVSLRSTAISNALISHELAHIIIHLEHEHLAIPDDVPRGSADRRMIGTLLSMFEHPNVYEIQRAFDFDVAAETEEKFKKYLSSVATLPAEHASDVRIEMIEGYVELHYIYPRDRLAQIDEVFDARSPRSFQIARTTLERVVTAARVARYAYREMLDAFVTENQLSGAYWPRRIRHVAPTRSD